MMERVKGGELFHRIVGRARFTEAEARALITPLLQAIAYIHGMGIIHRDIKVRCTHAHTHTPTHTHTHTHKHTHPYVGAQSRVLPVHELFHSLVCTFECHCFCILQHLLACTYNTVCVLCDFALLLSCGHCMACSTPLAIPAAGEYTVWRQLG